MRLTHVNIGKARTIAGGKQPPTGIFKQAATGPVLVTEFGLEGDFIGDTRHHGGRDQAVYIYGQADYDRWSEELARPVGPGTFGENLTIADLESSAFSVGDRLLIGEVVLEVTAPRIPCATLAARMDDPHFVKRFRDVERPGLYCRVIVEGFVEAGMAVEREIFGGERLTILEMFRDIYVPHTEEAALRRLVAAPAMAKYREKKLAALEKLLMQRRSPA